MTAFRDFLGLPQRTGKPRTSGLTHVLDKGLSLASLESLVEGVGEYVDIIKFGWGTAYITHGIRAKVALCDDYGIIACPGGTLFEIAVHQGRLKDYLNWLQQIGIRHIEISNGALGMSAEVKQRYIRQVVGEGLVVLSEVGSKDPRHAAVGSIWVSEMVADLESGATLVIAEGRESGTVGLYDQSGQPDPSLIEEVTKHIPADFVLFEAPRKDQQAWFIRELGSNVNLGNIPPADILNLETLRTGLRADTIGLLKSAPDQHPPTERSEPYACPPIIH